MSRKFFSILALFALLLTSCELHEPVKSVTQPQAKPGQCTPEYRTFPLLFTATGTQAYDVVLETGPFVVKECMCRVVEYDLSVTLGSAQIWKLMLSPNIAIPFDWSAVGSQDVLAITDLAPIFENIGDPSNGILKVKAGSNSQPNATLNNASGLCIIDNFDANGTTGYPIGTQVNSAIIIVEPGPNPNTYVVKVYIPEDMTSPV